MAETVHSSGEEETGGDQPPEDEREASPEQSRGRADRRAMSAQQRQRSRLKAFQQNRKFALTEMQTRNCLRSTSADNPAPYHLGMQIRYIDKMKLHRVAEMVHGQLTMLGKERATYRNVRNPRGKRMEILDTEYRCAACRRWYPLEVMCPACTVKNLEEDSLRVAVMTKAGWAVDPTIPVSISWAFFCSSDAYLRKISSEEDNVQLQFDHLAHYVALRSGDLTAASQLLLRFQTMVGESEHDDSLVFAEPQPCEKAPLFGFEFYNADTGELKIDDGAKVVYPDRMDPDEIIAAAEEYDRKFLELDEAAVLSGDDPMAVQEEVAAGEAASPGGQSMPPGGTASDGSYVHVNTEGVEHVPMDLDAKAGDDAEASNPPGSVGTAPAEEHSADYDADTAVP